jgi:spermidine/putrescine-binding protein
LSFVKRAAGVAAAMCLAVSAGAASAENITFVTFSGYCPPDLFAEFEKATGIGNSEPVAGLRWLVPRHIPPAGAGASHID